MVAVARINAEGTTNFSRRPGLPTRARIGRASAAADATSPAKAKLAELISRKVNPAGCMRVVISNATYRISATASSEAQRLIQRGIERLLKSGIFCELTTREQT